MNDALAWAITANSMTRIVDHDQLPPPTYVYDHLFRPEHTNDQIFDAVGTEHLLQYLFI
jgi:hypothetical protein